MQQLLAPLFLVSAMVAQAEPALRVLTYNVHGFGPIAATDAGRAQIRTVQKLGQLEQRFAMEIALAEPDVVALQEAVPATRVAALAERLGMQHRFFPGQWKSEGWPEGIATALLSRHPILESEDCPTPEGVERDEKLFSRSMGRALIDVDGRQVAVYVAHMLPAWKNTTDIRLREIRTVAAAAREDRDANRPVIVLGDMNHQPDTDEHRAWQAAGFLDAFAAVGKGQGLTCPANVPTERIDYVWTLGIGPKRILECRALATGAFVVHRDDPRSFALSDHIPVFAKIRLE